MSTKKYQFIGESIVTGKQLAETLKSYVPTSENGETVSWLEVTDTKIVMTMKDGREISYDINNSKDFETVECDDEGYLHFYDADGNDAYDPVYIAAGTGSGAGTSVRLTNQNGSSSLVASYGSAVTLLFTFSSTEDDLATGNGTCKITVNGITKYTTSIPQGLNSIDVSPYLNAGTNTVKVTCTDIYGISRSLTYTITFVQLTIESPFNATVTYNGDITFKYTPYGSVEKTVHFLIDGDEIGTVVTSLSGKQLTKTIPKMAHGTHRLEVYSTAIVNDMEITSPSLMYDILCIESNDTTPMIASVYADEHVEQGALISIPYIVYDPTKLACDVTLTCYTLESGSEVVYSTQDITVDRRQWTWNTRKYPIGTVYFRIAYGNISKTHTVTVTESSIKIEAETTDLELQLLSEARSNNETSPDQWIHGDVTTTFRNINWSSTGWVDDENGDTCLRLNGDARVEINFQPFASDLRTYGKTIELEFAIRDVHNRDAVPISCMSGAIGFEVKPDTTYLKSEQSEVFCNYKDNERVKVAFVIESRDESRLLSIYLNGVRSDAIQYPTTDNFQQSVPVNISIGSSDCGVDIYAIRSYTTALTPESVMNNFIADMTDVVRKTETFEDNDIYDDYGDISFSKAKEKYSIMVIVGDLPQSKGDKKSVTVQYYDIEDSNIDYIDQTVVIDVQGTSSQYYVRKNWKLKCSSEHYIDSDHLPAKVICIKVDYAEATGTHNTQNAVFVEKLYNEAIPPQADDPLTRTTIYGKPILLFHQENENSDPVFYGKSNYNYDKGAEYVFGFTNAYDVECWEFLNNTSDACNFLAELPEDWSEDFEARYPEESKNISRFKEMHDWVVSTRQDTATGNALTESYTDADGNVHTNDTAEYRLAKFKMEFEDHFNMHYSLIYYVYSFFALMVDQRAKNMFLTYWASVGKWYPYFYDNDTSFGINNEGQLVFDYHHEDVDQIEGANVYNGQNSVLWCNFREAFQDKIQETYQDLRSNSVLNYDELIEQFITKGSDKWSESIYNEDADFKYISMLRSDNDASNLGQVRGTGEEHFRYFIENRLNYCDSKWYAPDYADDYVALRIYTPSTWAGVEPNADITVTPYSHMYAGVRYKANGSLYQKRTAANETVTFEAPDETFNDTETAIYGASHISSLGDLSPLYCGSINVSNAIKLTELIVGSDVEGYSNPNLIDLSVGTNNLLRKLNVRNCPKLTDPLVLSGCPNIEEIYAGGSGITGIELASSGYLKVVELPATITNLTLINQLSIEELTFEGYDSIKTIQIENCPTVNSLDILDKAVNVERVRLTDVNWKYDDTSFLYELIDRDLAGLDENGTNTDTMWIDGVCHIPELTGAELGDIKAAFPYLTITYDTLVSQLVYMNHDGTKELYRETIYNEGSGIDPVENGAIDKPTRDSSAQYDFEFAGWSLTIDGRVNNNALLNIAEDRYVYAAFSTTIRSYTVSFYNGTTLLESVITEYGSDATYSGDTPIKEVDDEWSSPEDFEFIGWTPEPTNIQGDTNCYAQYYDLREITDDWDTINANCLNGTATDLYKIGARKSVDITYEDGTVESVFFEVIGHNHDELSDDTDREFMLDSSVSRSPVSYIRQVPCAFEYNNDIYICGGIYSAGHVYKFDGESFSLVTTLPNSYTFGYVSIMLYNDEIHVFGLNDYTEHWKYDWNEWVLVHTYDYTLKTSFIYNDEIYIVVNSTNSDVGTIMRHGADGLVEVAALGVHIYTNTQSIVHDGLVYINNDGNVFTFDGSTVNNLGSLSVNGALFSHKDELYFVNGANLYKYVDGDGELVTTITAAKYLGATFSFREHIYSVYGYDTYVYKNPNATLTFCAKNSLVPEGTWFNATAKTYDGVYTKSAGGWSLSDLRSYMNSDFLAFLPADLQGVIKEVRKVSDTGITPNETLTTDDKLWALSLSEIGCSLDDVLEWQGDVYTIFTDNASYTRPRPDGDIDNYYWTRSTSPDSSYAVAVINGNGTIIAVNPGNSVINGREYHVVPCFCI